VLTAKERLLVPPGASTDDQISVIGVVLGAVVLELLPHAETSTAMTSSAASLPNPKSRIPNPGKVTGA
jgi:hypothetical protein